MIHHGTAGIWKEKYGQYVQRCTLISSYTRQMCNDDTGIGAGGERGVTSASRSGGCRRLFTSPASVRGAVLAIERFTEGPSASTVFMKGGFHDVSAGSIASDFDFRRMSPEKKSVVSSIVSFNYRFRLI